MEYKDYYAIMEVERSATPDDIKRAHRRLARKYHPDVSKEKDAEARFKDLSEAYEVLRDPEKRAAYDRLGANWRSGQDFRPPPEWASRAQPQQESGETTFASDSGDFSDFFDTLFRGMGRGAGRSGSRSAHGQFDMNGQDQHAKIQINLEDSYQGATRSLQLRVPSQGEGGRVQMQDRSIEFVIPKGIRSGQHIRLAGQGAPGLGQGSPGDVYLDVEFVPHPLYRADQNDVYMDLPVAPWELALGADVEAPTPTGRVEIKIPTGSGPGRKLRLKGRGLPATAAGKPAGDFYVVLQPAQPAADSDAARLAWTQLAAAFPRFKPRAALDAIEKRLEEQS